LEASQNDVIIAVCLVLFEIVSQHLKVLKTFRRIVLEKTHQSGFVKEDLATLIFKVKVNPRIFLMMVDFLMSNNLVEFSYALIVGIILPDKMGKDGMIK
jgi:hypothetical protein